MLSLKQLNEAVAQLVAGFSLRGKRSARSNISNRAARIRPSNIRDAARLVTEMSAKTRVINLGQGLPQFPAPQFLKDAAKAAIDANINQYSNTWGDPLLRQAIARKFQRYNGITYNPETEITVTCGASEAINAALLATVNPGDEMIVFEPFYENYHPNAMIVDATLRYVQLREPDWTFDEKELEAAFNKRTKVVLLNTPHNPTGKVFSRQELGTIARLCCKWNVLVICDEIYEYMVYDGCRHVSMATLPCMRERTITVSGLSKTFSVTGWRLGYCAAPPELTKALRRVHDYLTLAAPSPLQAAAVVALNQSDDFYKELADKYREQRDQLCPMLEAAGFKFGKPQGTYYVFADCSHMGFATDRQAWEYMLRALGVATVAGYCFYRPDKSPRHLRFCYAKYPETIAEAGERLKVLKQQLISGKPLVVPPEPTS